MKKILVPTDFSDCAANALEFAIQSAKILPAEITLLHAFDRQGSLYNDYMGVNREFVQSLLHEAEDKLASISNDIRIRHGLNVNTLTLMNPLKDAIVGAAADKGFDLIVMGTSGASGLKEKLWGSNTAEIVAVCPVPLLVVPHSYTWQKPQKFLIATEHFELDNTILDKVFELAGLFMAQVEAAVFTADKEEPAVFLEHARKAPYYDDQLHRRYDERGFVTKQLYGSDLEKSLQAQIDKDHIDVLVMITYRRNFWNRLFHPSMTKKMSYHSHIPLLVMPVSS